ncbi:hypothetical protein AMS68_007217 [Peltaster fructicola]|uniref:Uncharacterized protein n=1 Tax=Peltaster fructicola TaxID=286661 RepID=A0A6H0Y513_9PEZI|nr:hypothetical protein AMS68_007217 [Peltaster fructicola]
MTKKKADSQAATPPPPPNTAPSSNLILCRNKHWKYISAFTGPWLNLPNEILESLAHQNWIMPSPRLIDPAVFFDIVKIRKYVDEASHDSVRASTGLSNIAMSGRMDCYGTGGGPGSQLSKERIFKVRQKAVTLLSKAYSVDEVATSVITMQATSTVEDVGQHVLKREPSNINAKYVHYFHEKVPSRHMEEHTSVEPLDEIISTLPWEEQAAPIRTRGLVHSYKQEYEQATADFTLALRIVEELKRTHKPELQELELASKMRAHQEAWQKGTKDWRSIPHLKEEERPKSLETQLLFNRAGAYLAMAVRDIHTSLDGLAEYQAAEAKGEINVAESAAHAVRLEARKRVKTNAKRALKDYLAFLSHFEYTPGLAYEVTNEIMRRMNDLRRGRKPSVDHSAGDNEKALAKGEPKKGPDDGWPDFPLPKIYPASMLFAERPPPDLPPYPGEQDCDADRLQKVLGYREVVTYHPLLSEALHSLLLAHTLLQTSTTELQRHAYNVARLTRIANGYPIFQTSRSPARSDWQEILADVKEKFSLSSSWQKLCFPVPLPDAAGGWAVSKASKARQMQASTMTSEELQNAQLRHESIIGALSDDRIMDAASFKKAVYARHDRALQQEKSESDRLLGNGTAQPQVQSKGKKPSQFVAANSLVSSDRAQAITRWMLEAPLSMGVKKKRPARRRKAADQIDGDALAGSVSALSVNDDDDVD